MTVATSPVLTPISRRTGNPRVPWTILLGTLAAFAAAACVVGAIFWVLWVAVHDYANASLLMQLAEQHKPEWVLNLDAKHPPVWSGWRIIMVLLAALIAVVVTATLTIASYFAYCGFAWSKWAALISIAGSGLAFLLIPLAWTALAGAGLLSVLVWLPPSTRFFAAWQHRRHPVVPEAEPELVVSYGPIPRYRP